MEEERQRQSLNFQAFSVNTPLLGRRSLRLSAKLTVLVSADVKDSSHFLILSPFFLLYFHTSSGLVPRLSCIKHGSLKYLKVPRITGKKAGIQILTLTLFIVF